MCIWKKKKELRMKRQRKTDEMGELFNLGIFIHCGVWVERIKNGNIHIIYDDDTHTHTHCIKNWERGG